MTWHYIEKEFYDNAEDIEAVSIHYVCTPLSTDPDWEQQRVTLYMPVVRAASQGKGQAEALPRRRRKILKLPARLPDVENSESTNRYLLHHYFEIYQDGSRHYSPLSTEEVVTNAQEAEALP